jgi:hypothetical protein
MQQNALKNTEVRSIRIDLKHFNSGELMAPGFARLLKDAGIDQRRGVEVIVMEKSDETFGKIGEHME